MTTKTPSPTPGATPAPPIVSLPYKLPHQQGEATDSGYTLSLSRQMFVLEDNTTIDCLEITIHRDGVATDTYPGPRIATLSWDTETGEIVQIWVSPKYRRQGVATDLWYKARDAHQGLRHSAERTADGEAWARSLNEDLPKLVLC